MTIKVLSIEHLEECLKDSYCIQYDKINDAIKILEEFRLKYDIHKVDVITSLSLVIYLDSIVTKENRSVVNRLKATIKDVEYQSSVGTNI